MDTREAEKYVTMATVIGVLGGIATLLFFLQRVFARGQTAAWWQMLDALILFALSYGLYRRSRVAATLMFVYFVANRLLMWRVLGTIEMLAIAILFGFLLFQGARATFCLHRLKQKP